jgi:hypothetical protein
MRNKSHWYCERCGAEFDYNPVPRTAINSSFYYCPVCGEMTEYTYVDSIGGEHGCGLGYAPNGEFCGECSKMSCDGCPVWEEMENEQN